MKQLLKNRLADPVIALLKQGITPEKIALSVAFGVVLGVFPVLGSTTILCAAAAFILRLNVAAIQLINFLIYPLQLLLLFPFIRAGERLLNAPGTQLSVAQMKAIVQTDFRGALHQLGAVAAHGILAWALVAPVALFAFYHLSLYLIRRAPAGVFTRPEIAE